MVRKRLRESEAILKNIGEMVRERIDGSTIFVGDGSDLAKPHGNAAIQTLHDAL